MPTLDILEKRVLETSGKKITKESGKSSKF
jgi:hypothetical protein